MKPNGKQLTSISRLNQQYQHNNNPRSSQSQKKIISSNGLSKHTTIFPNIPPQK
uniref:Uncharacterized protein n=1 Tax=Rhizophora mucronata TaxID=61149 RepID=A0A2P2R2I4_RHIMU